MNIKDKILNAKTDELIQFIRIDFVNQYIKIKEKTCIYILLYYVVNGHFSCTGQYCAILLFKTCYKKQERIPGISVVVTGESWLES